MVGRLVKISCRPDDVKRDLWDFRVIATYLVPNKEHAMISFISRAITRNYLKGRYRVFAILDNLLLCSTGASSTHGLLRSPVVAGVGAVRGFPLAFLGGEAAFVDGLAVTGTSVTGNSSMARLLPFALAAVRSAGVFLAPRLEAAAATAAAVGSATVSGAFDVSGFEDVSALGVFFTLRLRVVAAVSSTVLVGASIESSFFDFFEAAIVDEGQQLWMKTK